MFSMVQSLKDLSQLRLAAMVGTAVVLLGFFIFVSLRISSPVMTPLYNNIPLEEGGDIIAELDKKGIPYKVGMNGSQILVPSDQVAKLRMEMAKLGLPSKGSMTGYEIFDSSEALGTSNFVLNINKLRALEGELSRTIGSFNKVDTARVHLVMAKREVFSREQQEPTASVALKLKGGNTLAKEEIAAIRHMVATAVPGLKTHRITIVDSRGNLLAKGVDSDSDPQIFVEENEEFRIGYETRTRDTIERLLEQSVGAGKVKAEVHADIDFTKVITNSEKYDPEGQVARSIQNAEENERSNEKSANDNVSVGNNLPDAKSSDAGAASASERNRNEETTNFEISKTSSNQVKQGGEIKRMTVAVLVDGMYTTNAEGLQVYAPRPQEELDKLEDLVKSSIGFSTERGDEVKVINMQFAQDPNQQISEGAFDWLKEDLDDIVQTFVLGGVAVLAILLVIRPLVSRAIESAELAQEEEDLEQLALGGPSIAARIADQSSLAGEEEEELINIDRIQGKVKSSTFRKINDLVDKHPEETINVLRQWSGSNLAEAA